MASKGPRSIVCIKQVPKAQELQVDPVTKTLKRVGVPSEINPPDRNALEMALQIKDKHGGEVFVVTMGPPVFTQALEEALAMGCDRAWLLTDRILGGSDTVPTALALSDTIHKIGGYDLLFCGEETTDASTGHVGPGIAGHLDCAQISYCSELEYRGKTVVGKRTVEDGFEWWECPTPCMVTVNFLANRPRPQSLTGRIRVKRGGLITTRTWASTRTRCGSRTRPPSSRRWTRSSSPTGIRRSSAATRSRRSRTCSTRWRRTGCSPDDAPPGQVGAHRRVGVPRGSPRPIAGCEPPAPGSGPATRRESRLGRERRAPELERGDLRERGDRVRRGPRLPRGGPAARDVHVPTVHEGHGHADPEAQAGDRPVRRDEERSRPGRPAPRGDRDGVGGGLREARDRRGGEPGHDPPLLWRQVPRAHPLQAAPTADGLRASERLPDPAPAAGPKGRDRPRNHRGHGGGPGREGREVRGAPGAKGQPDRGRADRRGRRLRTSRA